jgi:predicted transcriptional regulator
MAKVQVAFRIDEELLAYIDRLAELEGETRTDVMVSALERGIAEEQKFVDGAKLAGLQTAVEMIVDSGLADPVYKLLGMQVDRRRVEISKRLRAERHKGSGIPKLKGA